MADQKTKNVRVFVAMTFVMIYFLLVYLNYNLPVFKQIFAHYFYVPIETEYHKGQNHFGCISTPNCGGRVKSIYDQNNNMSCGNSRREISNQAYRVNETIYPIGSLSYLQNSYCNNSLLLAYYFPLYPAWSVANNSLPNQQILENYQKTTKLIFTLLLIYIAIVFILIRKCRKYSEIRAIIKNDKKTHALICAIACPFLIVPVIHALSLSNGLEGIALLVSAFLLTLVFLSYSFRKYGYKKYFIGIFLTMFLWYVHLIVTDRMMRIIEIFH